MSLAILTRADRRTRAEAADGPREPVFARTAAPNAGEIRSS